MALERTALGRMGEHLWTCPNPFYHRLPPGWAPVYSVHCLCILGDQEALRKTSYLPPRKKLPRAGSRQGHVRHWEVGHRPFWFLQLREQNDASDQFTAWREQEAGTWSTVGRNFIMRHSEGWATSSVAGKLILHNHLFGRGSPWRTLKNGQFQHEQQKYKVTKKVRFSHSPTGRGGEGWGPYKLFVRLYVYGIKCLSVEHYYGSLLLLFSLQIQVTQPPIILTLHNRARGQAAFQTFPFFLLVSKALKSHNGIHTRECLLLPITFPSYLLTLTHVWSRTALNLSYPLPL